MTSSRRGLRILAVLVAVLVFGATGLALWIRSTADRRWAAAQDRIRQLVAAHPVVIPPMPAGRAKELQIHFVAAIKEAARTNSRGREAQSLVSARTVNDAVVTVVEEARDFLDRLHDGARAVGEASGELPPGWRGEWDPATILYMLNAGILRSRLQRKNLDPGDAAVTLLDSLQLARFWTISGKGDAWFKAVLALDGTTGELGDLLSGEAIPRGILLKIDAELERFDLDLPGATQGLEAELAAWAETLETMDLRAPAIREETSLRWRILLPDPLMRAEAFEFWDHQVQQMLAAEPKGYGALVGTSGRASEQCSNSRNPILRSGATFYPRLEFVDARARLRLVRVAARYRATGEILPLMDPYGKELHHAPSGGRMRFWSVGPDGRDDGGEATKDLTLGVDPPKPE